MPDRLPIPSEKMIEWEFQVEQQGFITRYGGLGGLFFKQVVLQFGALPKTYPIKLVSKRVYKTALRLSTTLK